jgi:SagB-type dehydrogenase family enzyme
MNRDLKIGRKHLIDQVYYRSRMSADSHDGPVSYDIRYRQPVTELQPLPDRVTETLGGMDGLGQEYELERKERDGLADLSALLHLTLGPLRYEEGTYRAFHRGVPSPRCLYPTDLYVITGPDEPPLDSGVYLYHPLQHALEQRRSGAFWPYLERALGRTLSGSFAVVIGTEFSRITHIYRDFGYTLMTLEAGHATGHLLLLSRRLGYEAQMHDLFLDEELIELTGLDGERETPLTVLVFEGRPQHEKGVSSRALPDQLPDLPPILAGSASDSAGAQAAGARQGQAAVQMAQASRLWTWSDLPHPASESELPLPQQEVPAAAVPLMDRAADETLWRLPALLDVIKERSSGNEKTGMMPALEALPFAAVSKLLRAYLDNAQPEWRDVREIVDVYVVANRVDGLTPGVYRLQEREGAGVLLPVWQGHIGERLQQISAYPPNFVNVIPLPLCLLFGVDVESQMRRHGNRGFQIAHLKAGQAAQYLGLAAGGLGWFSRPYRGFVSDLAESWMGIDSSSQTVLYSLLVGEHKSPYLSFDLGLRGGDR